MVLISLWSKVSYWRLVDKVCIKPGVLEKIIKSHPSQKSQVQVAIPGDKCASTQIVMEPAPDD
ncbi:MAG: hypothetical protein F6K63_13340 [Moorea sp. SIO1G6]|nr:hypothetical protein [Moorena sp. SIO1G6]